MPAKTDRFLAAAAGETRHKANALVAILVTVHLKSCIQQQCTKIIAAQLLMAGRVDGVEPDQVAGDVGGAGNGHAET